MAPQTINASIAIGQTTFPLRRRQIWCLLVAFALASGFYVLQEPAPYELLIIPVAGLCFALGLAIPKYIKQPALLVGFIIIGNLISVLPSQQPEVSTPYALVTIYLWMTSFFLACLVYENPRYVLPILWTGYGLAAVIATILGILGYFHLVPFHEILTKADRAKGLFQDPNVYGPFLYPAIFVCLVGLEKGSILKRLFLLGVAVLLLGGLFVGFSRASWAACIMGLVLLATLRFFGYQHKWERQRLVVVGVGLFGVFALLFAGMLTLPSVQEMFLTRAQLLQDYDVNAGGRFWVQRHALEMSLVTPFGIGPGHTPIIFEREPHNVYILTLIENGWLTGVSFLALIILTFIRGARVCLIPSSYQGIYTATFVALVANLANSMIIDSIHWRHLYVLFGLVWGGILATEARVRLESLVHRKYIQKNISRY